MHSKIFASPGFKHRQQYRAAKLDAKPARSGGGMSSTVTKNFRYMRCQDFSPLPRRERRAYPSAVCEERATPAAAKKTATLRAAQVSKILCHSTRKRTACPAWSLSRTAAG